jgi:methylated-DNA-[protein]-cysteine S-methyltransferase
MKTYAAYYNSTIGLIEVIGTGEGIVAVNFVEEPARKDPESHLCVEACIEQLDEYFRGARKEFSVNLVLQGTDFQKQVWKQLTKIPFGATGSYRDIAAALGKPTACRAVGNANGRNRISMIIPCHRVIGSNGKLVGYGGGLWRKEWLLQHEQFVITYEPKNFADKKS